MGGKTRCCLVLMWAACQGMYGSDHAGQAAAQDRTTAEREGPAAGAQKSRGFERSVAPVFKRHCVVCHGTKKREATLDLSSLDGLVRGGDSGPVVVPGSLKRSLLWTHVREQTMPPEGRPRLQSSEINTIRGWIDSAVDAARFVRPRYTQHEVLPILYLRCVVCHGGRVDIFFLKIQNLYGIHSYITCACKNVSGRQKTQI